MDPLTQLTAHLEFLGELGVAGVTRDKAWRTRDVAGDARRAAPAPVENEPATEARAGQPMPAEDTVQVSDSIEADRRDLASGQDRAAGLAAIRHDIGDCTRCKLHGLGRRQIVFGVGNPHAELMFAGEAPGRDEDLQGEPFVGRAGGLLTKMIEAMGYTRESVYIANVIKCRPPENRNPEPDEVAACEPFLVEQVKLIRPKVVVALGKFAAQTLLKTTEPISKLRGRVYSYGDAHLVPTFHPAYLLRNPDAKREAWEDLKRAMTLLGKG